MNYLSHYDQLVTRAKTRKLFGYKEKHHILPKCLGGKNAPENIIDLTPEEHYVAHQLLAKAFPENLKLLWAASNMTGKNGKQVRQNKLYGWLRKQLSSKLRGRIFSDETKKKLSLNHKGSSMKGRKHSRQTKIKMSLASKGKAKSEQHKLALSVAKIGVKRAPHSENHCQNLSAAMKKKKASLGQWNSGFLNDPEYQLKQSLIMKEIWRKRSLGDLPMPTYRKETYRGQLQ